MTTNELNKILFAMIGDSHLVNEWWNSQNKAFDYATPKEIYEETPDKVIDYVMKHYQR